MASKTAADQWRRNLNARIANNYGVGSSTGGHPGGLGGQPPGWGRSQGLQDMYKQQQAQGHLVSNWGTMPSKANVDAYVQRIGGNPYAGGGAAGGNLQQYRQKQMDAVLAQLEDKQKKKRKGDEEKLSQKDAMIEEFIESAKAARQEAKDANLARYDEGHGELSRLRDRTMYNISNFGDTAREDLRESYEQQLGNTLKDLQRQGFSSSSSGMAETIDNQRDLERAERQLSEQIMQNTANYDQRLTNNLVGFVERRDDTGPDLNQIYQMAKDYGLGNAGQGFDDGTQQQVAQQRWVNPGQRPQQVYGGVPALLGQQQQQQPQQNAMQQQQQLIGDQLAQLLQNRQDNAGAGAAGDAVDLDPGGRGRPGSRLPHPDVYIAKKKQRELERAARTAERKAINEQRNWERFWGS